MSGIQGSPNLPIWHLEYWCLSTRDSNTWIKVPESNTHHSTSLSSSLSLSGGQQREIIVSKSDTSVLITDYSPSKVYTFSVIAVSGNKQSRPLQGRFKGWFILYSCFIFSQIFSAFLLMTSLLLVFFLPSAKPYSVMQLTPISSSYPSFQFSLLLSCLDFFSFTSPPLISFPLFCVLPLIVFPHPLPPPHVALSLIVTQLWSVALHSVFSSAVSSPVTILE